MFQTFDPVSDKTFAAKHLPLLRAELEKQNLDGFVVPHDDEYQNEYIPAYAERLMWVSGFSGSAGSAIILKKTAIIFVDGRYTLQVRQQVDEAFFAFESVEATPPHLWLEKNGSKGDRIGYDPMLHTRDGVKRLEAAAAKCGVTLVAVTQNPIDKAWTDQPARPAARAFAHDTTFSGQSSADKRQEIASAVAKIGADAVLLTAPPSIAWLFNIRGGDVDRTPLPLARAIVTSDGAATLFIAPEKVDNELPGFLGDNVDIRGEDAVEQSLIALAQGGKKIALDPALAPAGYSQTLTAHDAAIIDMADPCALPRAAKNNVELDGTRAAHVRDGVAVTRFLHWFHTGGAAGLDEIGAAKKLEAFRHESDDLVDISFDSISGAGPNGAICHYRVTTESNRPLQDGELFLIDSGGQYKDGTTDITRTMPVGAPTTEMKDRFTRVLKGHIALATLVFPAGTTGHQIDVVARRPLWEAGLDYDHGTGHGVGSFMGVHEGPQRIAKAMNAQVLKPGMILSNEPGFYKAGEFGIRIENLVIVTPATPVAGGEREMMGFETITLAPISRDLIDASLLTAPEKDWLNSYHERVREALSPLLPGDVAEWLAEQTKAI